LGRYSKAPRWKADRAVQVGVGGHDDDRQVGQLLLDLAQQIQARAAGHADVADQHLGLVVGQRRQHLAGLAKLRTGSCSRASAFSSTKRMD
jgi:hypothetical protein